MSYINTEDMAFVFTFSTQNLNIAFEQSVQNYKGACEIK